MGTIRLWLGYLSVPLTARMRAVLYRPACGDMHIIADMEWRGVVQTELTINLILFRTDLFFILTCKI